MTRRPVELPQDIQQAPEAIPAKPRSKVSSLSSLIPLPFLLEFVERVKQHVLTFGAAIAMPSTQGSMLSTNQ
jgi:hypothetical protein